MRLCDARARRGPHARRVGVRLALVGVCADPFEPSSIVRRGRSDVYDDDTLRYATDVVSRHDGDEHLLLWVNLLALRDIDYVRTSSSSTSSARWLDRRSHPDSLHTLVPQVTEAVSREFYKRDAPRSIPRHTETEFSNLLQHSVETLDRHMQRVRRFILSVLERFPDASVCHTASHSLAIGEHGMRGGHTPMSTTCTTFVSSRPSTSRCDNLDALLSDFILDALCIAHPPDMGQAITSVPSLGLTRIPHGVFPFFVNFFSTWLISRPFHLRMLQNI